MYRNIRRTLFAMAGLAALGIAAPANATLIGDDIDLTVSLEGASDKMFAATVGNGIEFDLGDITIDVGASRIDFAIVDPDAAFAAGVTYALTDLDWFGMAGEITDAVLIMFQEVDSQIEFTADSVTLERGDFSLVELEAGLFASIELVTQHSGGGGDVPGPGALALFAVGLAGLGLATGRGRSAA